MNSKTLMRVTVGHLFAMAHTEIAAIRAVPAAIGINIQ